MSELFTVRIISADGEEVHPVDIEDILTTALENRYDSPFVIECEGLLEGSKS